MPPDSPGISRRGLLKGGGAVAFAGVSLAALKLPFFSTCSTSKSEMAVWNRGSQFTRRLSL